MGSNISSKDSKMHENLLRIGEKNWQKNVCFKLAKYVILKWAIFVVFT